MRSTVRLLLVRVTNRIRCGDPCPIAIMVGESGVRAGFPEEPFHENKNGLAISPLSISVFVALMHPLSSLAHEWRDSKISAVGAETREKRAPQKRRTFFSSAEGLRFTTCSHPSSSVRFAIRPGENRLDPGHPSWVRGGKGLPRHRVGILPVPKRINPMQGFDHVVGALGR